MKIGKHIILGTTLVLYLLVGGAGDCVSCSLACFLDHLVHGFHGAAPCESCGGCEPGEHEHEHGGEAPAPCEHHRHDCADLVHPHFLALPSSCGREDQRDFDEETGGQHLPLLPSLVNPVGLAPPGDRLRSPLPAGARDAREVPVYLQHRQLRI